MEAHDTVSQLVKRENPLPVEAEKRITEAMKIVEQFPVQIPDTKPAQGHWQLSR